MKLKILCALLISIFITTSSAFGILYFYPADSPTTGDSALDTYDASGINDGDGGFVITSDGDFCVYVLNADSTCGGTTAESPCPHYIVPAGTPGDKCWDLTDVNGASMSTTPSATPTITMKDSDDSAGTAYIYGNSDGGTNAIVMSVGVEETDGTENVSYMQLDGANKTVTIQKVLSTTPQSKNYSTSDDDNETVGVDITSSIVLVTGSNDSDICSIDLQDGTVTGQSLTFVGLALIDADDTFSIDVASDSTCTNCPGAGVFTFDDPGDTVELYWTGSAWVYINSYEVD